MLPRIGNALIQGKANIEGLEVGGFDKKPSPLTPTHLLIRDKEEMKGTGKADTLGLEKTDGLKVGLTYSLHVLRSTGIDTVIVTVRIVDAGGREGRVIPELLVDRNNIGVGVEEDGR